MNNVNIRINSYSQNTQILINGVEPSLYSELRNFTYQHFISSPAEILDALGRELNDDFTLAVCGNPYEVSLYARVAQQNNFCEAFSIVDAPLCLSSTDRAETLGAALPQQEVLVSTSLPVPAPCLHYGNLTLRFDDGPDAASIGADVSADLLIAACETLLVNPAIGKAVAALADPTPEQALCARQTPFFSVSVPEHMEVGSKAVVSVQTFPENCTAPAITLRSRNPDILATEGDSLVAKAPGTTEIRAYIQGENKPFFTKPVLVERIVYVSSITIELPEFGLEGTSVPIKISMQPADASDTDSLTLEVSDPSIAEIRGNEFVMKRAGTCNITARTTRALAGRDVVVKPKLQALCLSEHNITVNVGRTVPVAVNLTPENAFAAEYTWTSSDPSVAVVLETEGQPVIKAVGIGSCKLTCSSTDGQTKDECAVTVESIMYKRTEKKGLTRFVVPIVVALGLALLFFLVAPSLATNPKDSDNPLNQENLIPNKEAIENAVLDADLTTLLDAALAASQERESNDAKWFSIEEPSEVCAVFLLTAKNSEEPEEDWVLGLEMQNAVFVFTRYGMCSESPTSGAQCSYVYNTVFAPNCAVSSAGELKYDINERYQYVVSVDTEDELPNWFAKNFPKMDIKQIF